MNIGLYFGSFNPIHIGHLIIANSALNETPIDKIWIVVSPQNPFKQDEYLLNENARFSLVEKAISGDERLEACNIEFDLPRPSYTFRTLAHLRETYPENRFFLIIGSDSLQQLPEWKNFESIISNHKIFVYRRRGFDIDNRINADIYVLTAPMLDISSTEIRELIRNSQSTRYLLPDKVREEIEANDYYRK